MTTDPVRRRGRRRAVVWLVVALSGSVLVAPADAGVRQTGRVTYVVDGDTFDVDFDRDGDPDARIRLIGIDTPEMGTCGSVGAKKALRSLIGGRRVELTADDADANGIKGRLMRRATVDLASGPVDATKWLLERGWCPWMPRPNETTRNYSHHYAASKAAASNLRYFDNDRCASGPGQANPLKVHAQWQPDAVGNDWLNQEFIRITNEGATGIDVDRWHLNMGGVRNLVIPSGGPIGPGETLTIHVGKGDNSRYHRYLNRGLPLLKNANLDDDTPHLGDGVYVLDRDWDLRGHMMWPCVRSCVDPTGGDLQITHVEWNPPGVPYTQEHLYEYVRFENKGSGSIHTGNLVFDLHPYIYELPPGHWMGPGDTLEIRVRSGTDTPDVRYLGSSKAVLNDGGDRVLVRTYDGIVIDCVSWGTSSCPS